GKGLWTSRIGKAATNIFMYSVMRWLSPRVPTVGEDRIFAITADGDLTCRSTESGAELWRKSYPEDFQSKGRNWGYCDYPLVDGETLICVPGGPEATVAALKTRTGELVWKTALPREESSHYAAPVVSTGGGIRH